MARITPKRYLLSANRETELPSNILIVDTETTSTRGPKPLDPETLRFRLGACCHVRLERDRIHSEQWLDFHKPQAFWQFAESCQQAKKPLWIFAHNLAFDATILDFWNELDRGQFRLDHDYEVTLKNGEKRTRKFRGLVCLDDRPVFAKLLGKRGTVWLCDSFNYWPLSLAELAKSHGMEKGDYNESQHSEEDLQAYCRNDVAILRKALLELFCTWRALDAGNWKPTAAGLSLSSFRHWHADTREQGNGVTTRHDIAIDRDRPSIQLERECNRGGRVEAFYLGEFPRRKLNNDFLPFGGSELDDSPYYHLDVRSLYPSVMNSERFPSAFVSMLHNPEVHEVATLLRKYGAAAQVVIDSPADTYPVIHDDRMVFARGRFTTWLCGAELRRAVDNLHVASVYDCAFYKLAPLFSEWVQRWWSIREEADRQGDTARSLLAKLILNSLSGKFGQRPEKWEVQPEAIAWRRWGDWRRLDPATGRNRKFRGLAGKVLEKVVGDEPPHAFPIISAFVTSAARERMRNLMALCPYRSVFYLATDALICNRFAFERLQAAGEINPHVMGKLAVKGCYPKGSIVGQNAYTLGGKFTAAGLWGRVTEGVDGRKYADVWQRLNSILQGKPDGSITINHVELSELATLPKGAIGPDGWVEPYTFSAGSPPTPRSNDHMETKRAREQ